MLLESLKNSLHAVRDIQEYSTKEKTQPQKPENMKKLLTLYHKIRNNRIIVRTTHKQGNNRRWSIALNQLASQPSEESIIKRWICIAWPRMIWKPSGWKTHSCTIHSRSSHGHIHSPGGRICKDHFVPSKFHCHSEITSINGMPSEPVDGRILTQWRVRVTRVWSCKSPRRQW